MTYEEIFSKAKELLTSGSTAGFKGDFAIQINITGEGEGIFYIAFKNGALAVEPYDYRDNDAVLTASADDFLKIADGSLNAVLAFTTGKLKVDGSVDKALELQKMIEVIAKSKKAEKSAPKTTKPAGRASKSKSKKK